MIPCEYQAARPTLFPRCSRPGRPDPSLTLGMTACQCLLVAEDVGGVAQAGAARGKEGGREDRRGEHHREGDPEAGLPGGDVEEQALENARRDQRSRKAREDPDPGEPCSAPEKEPQD